jgi:hypothetical protein
VILREVHGGRRGSGYKVSVIYLDFDLLIIIPPFLLYNILHFGKARNNPPYLPTTILHPTILLKQHDTNNIKKNINFFINIIPDSIV